MTARRKRSSAPAAPTGPLVSGFRAAGVACGIKKSGLDLALILSDLPASVAGVFTRSTVVGAPVELCRERVRNGRARAIVVNSGISNVAMGARGRRDAAAMAASAARAAGVPESEVLVASTGVIGEPLPMAKVRAGIEKAAGTLRAGGIASAARAIMTTDTFPKVASRRIRLGGKLVTLAGIAKGSGMIEPNMATMLSFLMTDAAIAPPLLRRMLRAAADESYNRLTIDGEGSTSDTVLLLANGSSRAPLLRTERSPGAQRFAEALGELTVDLTQALARDGEGATKLVTVRVSGARSHADAEHAARRIANSLLVKTAIFGGDPNWGRILQTVGAGRVALDLAKTEVKLCGVAVFRRGSSAGPAARRRAGERLASRSEVDLDVALGRGRGAATLWTCDLTYDYVRINAEYTT
jgi:glutamate N-acetyltransferase/amino-acid N-acetyltransferase